MLALSLTKRIKREPLVALVLLALLAGCQPPRGRQPNFFPSLRPATPPIQPPQDHLKVWLEGSAPGGGTYLLNGSSPATRGGPVDIWSDVRQGERLVSAFRPQFTGQRVDVSLIARNGAAVTVPALRCGDPNNSAVRCAFVPFDPDAPTHDVRLDSSPYTILGVVRRSSNRGDNYFVTTDANGRCGGAGGTSCPGDSALHVGWVGGTTLRAGQYYDDVDLDPVPSFDSVNTPISLIAARRGSVGKQVALLEGGFNFFNTEASTTLLSNSGALWIGGTPFGARPSVPDWRFVGDILAVLVYDKDLDPLELLQAQDYLRTSYGPR